MKTIKSKILFIAGASALLFCAVIIWLTNNVSEKHRAAIVSDCAYVTDSEFKYIEDSLKLIEEQANDLARLGGVYYRLTAGGFEIVKEDIIDNLRFDNNYVGGGVWFEPYSVLPGTERFCFYAYKDGGELVYDEGFESAEYDYPRQEWYVDIVAKLKNGERTAWHGPYADEAGSHATMMTVGAGIYSREGALVGMATTDLNIDFMLNLSADLNFTPGTSMSFTNEETGGLISESGSRDSSVDALDFSKLFDNGVRLSLSVPKDELFGDVDKMARNMFIITLAIVLLSFIVIYSLLDRLINRPMSYISAKTKEIGKGNLDAVIEIKNDDEIGQLGSVINKMTDDLKQYIKNLESVTKENERIFSELEIAGKIQREMLPELRLNNDGYDIHAEMLPCLEVGGDFYDAFLVGDDNLCVVIADVSGKGVPAALFMANAKTTIKSFAQTEPSPAEILMNANRQLCYGNKTRMFVTAFLGILNLKTGVFTYANAGHNPPLVMLYGSDFEYLKPEQGIVLGISKNAVYTESSVKFKRGDRIFLYTDGVTETFNCCNEPFGEIRLKEALNKYETNGLIEMTAAVEKELYAFAEGAHMRDDITILLLEFVDKKR